MSFTVYLTGEKTISTQKEFATAKKTQLDSSQIIINFEPSTFSSKLKGDGFAIVKDDKILVSSSNISTKHNWIEVFLSFVQNYNTPGDIDGYYAYGQIVPETTEYLCKDCGYIEEFEAGSVFPVCEVCQAGEPDGPCGPNEGYWEKL
jgi:hypothetical protein